MKKKLIVVGLALAFAAPLAHAGDWSWMQFFWGSWHFIDPSIANN